MDTWQIIQLNSLEYTYISIISQRYCESTTIRNTVSVDKQMYARKIEGQLDLIVSGHCTTAHFHWAVEEIQRCYKKEQPPDMCWQVVLAKFYTQNPHLRKLNRT